MLSRMLTHASAIHSRFPGSLLARAPLPVAHLGHILAVLGDKQLVALHDLGVALLELRVAERQPGHILYGVQRQSVTIELIEDGHVEGRGRGALLLISVDV